MAYETVQVESSPAAAARSAGRRSRAMSNRQWDEVQHAFAGTASSSSATKLTPTAHRIRAALGPDRRQPLLHAVKGYRDRRGAQGTGAEDQHRRRLAHRSQLRSGAGVGSILLACDCRRRAATRCSPTCIAPSKRSRPACSAPGGNERRARLGASSAPRGERGQSNRRRAMETSISSATTSSTRW